VFNTCVGSLEKGGRGSFEGGSGKMTSVWFSFSLIGLLKSRKERKGGDAGKLPILLNELASLRRKKRRGLRSSA